jgi:hypothetical protein
MRKILSGTLAAVALATGALAVPSSADAQDYWHHRDGNWHGRDDWRHRDGWGRGGAFLGGAIVGGVVGSALATPAYGYGYGYPSYYDDGYYADTYYDTAPEVVYVQPRRRVVRERVYVQPRYVHPRRKVVYVEQPRRVKRVVRREYRAY